MIRDGGLPNFLKCRIPEISNLNIDRWRFHLSNYLDQHVLDHLQYGFPLDFRRECPLMSTLTNHTSALQNSEHVTKYLLEEIQHKAIMGHFSRPTCIPFNDQGQTRFKSKEDHNGLELA